MAVNTLKQAGKDINILFPGRSFCQSCRSESGLPDGRGIYCDGSREGLDSLELEQVHPCNAGLSACG